MQLPIYLFVNVSVLVGVVDTAAFAVLVIVIFAAFCSCE